MSWLRFFRRRHWDQERARELQAYLDIETDENIARGMPPEEARYAARRKLGNPFLIREEIYRMNSIGIVESLCKDLRYGARLLRLNPAFALVAILSLALGIGANTAIFQLLDAVRLRTLPVKNPQELASVRIANHVWGAGRFSGAHPEFTNPLWEQLREHQQAFSSIAAWSSDNFNLTAGGEMRLAQGLVVSGDFFNVLGVRPALGRFFTPEDDRRGCGSPGVVISYPFWRREYGGEASVLGRKLRLQNHSFEIIGVTPAGFFGVEVGRSFDLAVPICSVSIFGGAGSPLNARSEWWLAVLGRLKPGWSTAKASAHLNAISPGLFQETMPTGYDSDLKEYLRLRLGAFPAAAGFSSLRDKYSDPLWLLLAIAGLVLLIACANLANLMLARASARGREIAVRLAMGASRGRIVRQLLAESLLLAGLGAAAGALVARSLSRFLVSFLSTEGDPLFLDLQADWRVLGFIAGLAILTCVLFGLTPALRATRMAPGAAMKTGSRGLTATRERYGLRRVIVISQVALSLVLLVGALLFVRSLQNLLTLDAGFRENGILIAYLDFSRVSVAKGRVAAFKQNLLERARAVPGVEGAATASVIPLRGDSWTLGVRIKDSAERERSSRFNWITPGYFRTMGTPLLAGRDFDNRDAPGSPKVAIVNEEFARKLLNGANPIGKAFRTVAEPNYPETAYQIVGLAKNSKYNDLHKPFEPIVFAAAAQRVDDSLVAQVLIRSQAPLAALIPALKSAMNEVSPEISVDFHVFSAQIRERLLPERLMATLSGFFGLLAAVLATIGLYGVVSYMVAQRTNEIGIRMALGADGPQVLRMILGEAGFVLAAGLALGTILAFAAAGAAGSMLYGLQPRDPVTFGVAIVLLAAVAALASYFPARRAAKLDPMVALRDE